MWAGLVVFMSGLDLLVSMAERTGAFTFFAVIFFPCHLGSYFAEHWKRVPKISERLIFVGFAFVLAALAFGGQEIVARNLGLEPLSYFRGDRWTVVFVLLMLSGASFVVLWAMPAVARQHLERLGSKVAGD